MTARAKRPRVQEEVCEKKQVRVKIFQHLPRVSGSLAEDDRHQSEEMAARAKATAASGTYEAAGDRYGI